VADVLLDAGNAFAQTDESLRLIIPTGFVTRALGDTLASFGY
jgi:hypothetical protein